MNAPPSPVPIVEPAPDAATLAVLVRLEAKVDVALAHQGAAISAQEGKTDRLEREHEDHERRLRTLEDRRTIAPRELWTAVVSGVGLVLTIVTLWNALNPGA